MSKHAALLCLPPFASGSDDPYRNIYQFEINVGVHNFFCVYVTVSLYNRSLCRFPKFVKDYVDKQL